MGRDEIKTRYKWRNFSEQNGGSAFHAREDALGQRGAHTRALRVVAFEKYWLTFPREGNGIKRKRQQRRQHTAYGNIPWHPFCQNASQIPPISAESAGVSRRQNNRQPLYKLCRKLENPWWKQFIPRPKLASKKKIYGKF